MSHDKAFIWFSIHWLLTGGYRDGLMLNQASDDSLEAESLKVYWADLNSEVRTLSFTY